MFKNALLSIKKSIGKSVLLFILMCVVANLVIAGLSIKEATTKSMDQVRTSLGSDVTLSYNMQNMMKDREKGSTMEDVLTPITLEMADQLKKLQYVKNYNYTINASVTSEDIDPVAMEASQEILTNRPSFGESTKPMMDQNDFTVVGNTSMENLSSFKNENYALKEGRLLTKEDNDKGYCVIETNVASDNDLSVGDKFVVTTTNDDNEEVKVELEVVGIYEIKTASQMGGMMSNRQSPYNQIYTGLQTAQTLNSSTTEISSATYYLDDPDHIDSFKSLAKEKTDIDFDTFSLDANDMAYQSSIASLENMESFASIFLWVVIIAGSVILCLILILTLRSRFYEFGVFLSLGQARIKIILQQLLEVLFIALIAFTISLGTGKMVSNVVSSMLEGTQSSSQVIMTMGDDEEITQGNQGKSSFFDKAMQTPTHTELDVSITSTTVIQLLMITGAICLVSIALPSIYISRLSPREILIKKEG